MLKKKAFTLVELIVVITILAILGTIAFTSFQNFSKDARDAKRISDIRNLYSKISIEHTKGQSYSELVVTEEIVRLRINGNLTDVGQGIVNFEAIKENPDNFKDPKTNGDYRVAYYIKGKNLVIGKNELQDEYLLAAINTVPSQQDAIEIGTVKESDYTAVVIGNYIKIHDDDTLSLLVVDYEDEDNYTPIVNGGGGLPYNPGITYKNCSGSFDGYNLGDTPHNSKTTGTKEIKIQNGKVEYTQTFKCFNGVYTAQGTLIKKETCDETEGTKYLWIEDSEKENGGSCEANLCNGGVPSENVIVSSQQSISGTWQNTNQEELGLCEFKCKENYDYNEEDNTCDAKTQEFICDSKPSTAIWNTVEKYTQTWDGERFLPVDSVTEYNEEASDTSCRFKCAEGYRFENSECVIGDFELTLMMGTSGYGNGDNTMKFNVEAYGEYTIDWGDSSGLQKYGTTGTLTSSTIEHTYSSAGTKNVTIKGDLRRYYSYGADGLTDVSNYAGKLTAVTKWDNIKWSSFAYMFAFANKLTDIPSQAPDLSNVINFAYTFLSASTFNDADVGNWDTSNVTDLSGTFRSASAFNQNLGNWKVDNVLQMSATFWYATSFKGTGLEKWNTGNVKSMGHMFVSVPLTGDITGWDVSNVTNMSTMFVASHINQDLSNWNTAKVIHMDRMFQSAAFFSHDLSGWNVANVTAYETFDTGTTSWEDGKQPKFNCPNGGTYVKGGCKLPELGLVYMVGTSGYGNGDNTVKFNLQAQGEYTIDWGEGAGEQTYGTAGKLTSLTPEHAYSSAGTKNVTIKGDIKRFWNQVVIFESTQDASYHGKLTAVTKWDGIKWTETSRMFYMANNLTSITDTAPNLSLVTQANHMFSNASKFDGDLSNWDTSSIENLQDSFKKCTLFTGKGLDKWDVSSLTRFRWTFANAINFTADISSWDVSSVETFRAAFYGATKFNIDISGWAVNNSTDMEGMFQGATGFNQDLSGWSVSNVLNYKNFDTGATTWEDGKQPKFNCPEGQVYAKGGCKIPELGLTYTLGSGYGNGDNTVKFNLQAQGEYTIDWGEGAGEQTYGTAGTLTSLTPEHTYSSTGAKNVTIKGNIKRFWNPITFASTGNWNDNNNDYHGKLTAVTKWDNVKWSSMDDMFYSADNLVDIPTTIPDMKQVTSMARIFMHAKKFNKAIVGTWNTSNIANMGYIFAYADTFNQDLGSWDVRKVSSLYDAFFAALAYEGKGLENWDTANLQNIASTFSLASNFNGKIGSWKIGKVTSLSHIFWGCTKFNQDISQWNTSNVSNMSYAFQGAILFNSNISTWDTSKVTTMISTFHTAQKFNQNLSGWDVSKVTDHTDFDNGALLWTNSALKPNFQ